MALEIADLTREEKTLFAGCIKRLVLADGEIDDAEIAHVDQLRDVEDFGDLDERLDEFEKRIHNEDEFRALAESTGRPEARALILRRLKEIALSNGYESVAESAFFRLLSGWFGIQGEQA